MGKVVQYADPRTGYGLPVKLRSQVTVADQEQLQRSLQFAHRRQQIQQSLALDEPSGIADGEGALARNGHALPVGHRGRSERNLSTRTPFARERSGAVGAGGHERRVAQHPRAQPAHRGREWPVDVLIALDSERYAQPCERTAPLGCAQRIRLSLHESHVGTRASAQCATAGQIEVSLRATGKDDRRRTQRRLHALERLRGHRRLGVGVAPAAGHDDRDIPSASRQLPVDLLVDAHHRGMADHKQPPLAPRRAGVACGGVVCGHEDVQTGCRSVGGDCARFAHRLIFAGILARCRSGHATL